MVFNGSNKMYIRLMMLGLPLSAVMFFIAFFTQGEEFSVINAFLFTAGGGVAGGFVGVPLVYMLGGEKRVLLTENELRLEEGKHLKIAKYSNIQNVEFNGKKIDIKLSKGKITIINIHGYPLKDIHQRLEENRANLSS